MPDARVPEVSVNFIPYHELDVAILSPTKDATDNFTGLGPILLETFRSRFQVGQVNAVFCLFSSGDAVNLGRADRDRISKGIYESAAKLNGLILTNGEDKGLAQEIGKARDNYCQIYDDCVSLVGISDNQDLLKLHKINSDHHGAICVKESVVTRTIPQELLWLKCMETLASELSLLSTERHSDLVPTVMALNCGDAKVLRSISQVALLSPLLRPSLIILRHTGGLADLIGAILDYLMKTAQTYESGYNQLLYLFGEGYQQMKKRLTKICSSRDSFSQFLRDCLEDKHSLSIDVDELREKVLILFSKCFILPSDILADFDELIENALFPRVRVAEMTVEECRLRLVKTSLLVNKVNIAQRAVRDAQKDKDFEDWMMSNQVYEDFLHEAFDKNNTDFFTDLLGNLPRSFLTRDFINSESFFGFVASWLKTDFTVTHFSFMDSKSLQSQIHRVKQNDPKQEQKLLDILSHALFKLNLDLGPG